MASITGNINDLMVSEKGSLRNIIANLNSLSQTLKSKEGQIGHILTNVDKFTDSLSKSQFPTAIAEMTVTLNRLNTTLDKVNNGEGTVGKFVNDQALYDSLVDASATFRRCFTTSGASETLHQYFGLRGRPQPGLNTL